MFRSPWITYSGMVGTTGAVGVENTIVGLFVNPYPPLRTFTPSIFPESRTELPVSCPCPEPSEIVKLAVLLM